MDFHLTDLLAILTIIVLNGLLSADNALVLAVIVLGLPAGQRRQALHYGILGAFGFQTIATILARYLMRLGWVKLLGGGYRLYLTVQHFSQRGGATERHRPRQARAWLGLSAFWATVVKVELTDIMFAIDSILVAVAISPKLYVVIVGLILAIIVMRLLIGRLLVLVQRYPAIVDGAFIIIAWVALKLLIEFLNQMGYIALEIPMWLSLGLIGVIFAGAYLYARRQAPVAVASIDEAEAVQLLVEEQK